MEETRSRKGRCEVSGSGGRVPPKEGASPGQHLCPQGQSQGLRSCLSSWDSFPSPSQGRSNLLPLGDRARLSSRGDWAPGPALLLTWQFPSDLPSLGMMLGPPCGHLSQGRGLWSGARGLPRL